MSLFQAEMKYFLRSPIIWIIAGLSAILSAWSFLLAIEIFVSMQSKFAGMTDAPTIVQGVIFPVISSQAKLLLLVVPIIAGLTFSRLHNNSGWSLLNSYGYSEWHFIIQKFMAVFSVSLLFIAPSFLAVLLLAMMTKISLLPVLFAMIGLVLLLLWMLAICMYISSLVANSGFAILLCLVVVVILWSISYSGLGAQWGKNWLQVISPNYHFQNFLTSYLPFSSLFYFILGSIFCVWAIKLRLIHRRYILS